MRVSVVICTHTVDRYDDLMEAAESILEQTYDDVEVILVADGSTPVCDRLHQDFDDNESVRIHCNEANIGLAGSRNNGVEVATGDVFAFMDDDAIADEEWVETLVETYEETDTPAVGGKMTPAWVAGKPAWLPEEFYWLVGVTHRGFADEPGEVRNTFGSNISFRRDVFEELGGFDTDMGRFGEVNLQAEETELCARMQREFDHGVYYNPEATVAHKVFSYRIRLRWLLDRAFWQGYSKRMMQSLVPDSGGDESTFLRQLLTQFVPSRAKSLITGPSLAGLQQFLMLFVFTATVGAGYLYGALRGSPAE